MKETGGGAASAVGGHGGGSVRVVVFDASGESGAALKTALEKAAGVRVVEQLSDPARIAPALERGGIELLVANLDPDPEAPLSAVGKLKQCPAALFAVSSQNDANLILKAVRSGFTEFVRMPEEAARLEEAVGNLRAKSAAQSGDGKIITVLGSTGGVGCTSLAVNLAVELSDAGDCEVALVDMDFLFGHVAMMLDLEIQYSISEVCGEGKTVDERVLTKALLKHKTGVHVLARPREFEETADLTAEACVPALHVLKKLYPFVVLDGPTRTDPTALSVLQISDWNLLVVQPLVTCMRNAKRIIEALERLDFSRDRIQVICNRSGGGGTHLTAQRLEKSIGGNILASIPDDWMSVSGGINLGEPLLLHAPRSKARESIRELADSLAGKGADGERGGGIFGRLFGRKPGVESGG